MTSPRILTEEAVRNELRLAVKAAGGQRAWAKAKGFSASYVNDVLLKRRPPAENICASLGITRTVVYAISYAKARVSS